jgi:hypothetical protein
MNYLDSLPRVTDFCDPKLAFLHADFSLFHAKSSNFSLILIKATIFLLMNVSLIINMITSSSWYLGQVERRELGTLLKNIFRGNIKGKMIGGRSGKKWMEEVDESLRGMGIKVWRRKAQERNE